MVTFTHRDESTSPETWEQSDTLAAAPPLEGGIAHLVLFAAHPDDETLGAGALIVVAALLAFLTPVYREVSAAYARTRVEDRPATTAAPPQVPPGD